ncbi:MAG: aminotransferase class V-fold PLP-dependent enzyme [Actinomycetota bacterium]|nr:aminotransferase class V-fold PLP-dependent enzyme [Actinomycetota bacterium]
MSSLRVSAPLLDAYLTYFETRHIPFTIPGHKQRASRLDAGLGLVVDSDTPLYGGLDEIKLSNQVLAKAEALAARLWRADYARFSTGGSTHANQAMILALGKPGDKVALSRTAHRSVLSALVLAGLEPIWLTPEVDSVTGVPTGISVAEFEKIIDQRPIALLLTEPGYLGTLSDLQALVKSAHAHAIAVIVDAAWGGHFGFSSAVPGHCLALGADALITSTHKALPGYSASALLIAQGRYLNIERIEQSFETTHTTSPAGAPLASIDGCRALLELRGEELITKLVADVEAFKTQVQSHFDLPIFLNPQDFPPGRFDPTKIVLRANQLGASGIDIELALQEQSIRVEMADGDTVVFLATLADSQTEFAELERVLIPILKNCARTPRATATSLSWSVVPTVAISMRDAYFADTEMVSVHDALGRICADLIAPYPPGVAVVAPGEVLTQVIIQGLAATKAAGVRIAYASDPTLKNFRVIKN